MVGGVRYGDLEALSNVVDRDLTELGRTRGDRRRQRDCEGGHDRAGVLGKPLREDDERRSYALNLTNVCRTVQQRPLAKELDSVSVVRGSWTKGVSRGK